MLDAKTTLSNLALLRKMRKGMLIHYVGKVYIVSTTGNVLIGEGYDTLIDFTVKFYANRIDKASAEEKLLNMIERRLEDTERSEKMDFFVGDGTTIVYEVPIQTLTMPEVPEVILHDCVCEKRKEPVPPYRQKLHAYDKRRNYGNKNNWNRIRSRLF